MTKAKDLRDQSLDELEAAYRDKQNELFQFLNERSQTRQFAKPHRIRLARKEIARILTIISEKKAIV